MNKVSKTIERRYDIVVIGGGLAGICAALAAARLGSKVALIHDRPVLGGAASSESRAPIGGAMSWGGRHDIWYHYARETGIIEEIALENSFRNPGSIWSLWDMVLWEKVSAEPKITLYLNTSAMKSKMKDNSTIAGVYAWQSTTFQEFLVEGDIFIDASGDGHIAYDAGAEYRMGRESKDEFGESLAPEKADAYTMALTIMIGWRDVGRPVSFTPPKWAKTLSDAELLPMKATRTERGSYPGNRFHDAVHLKTQEMGFWWLEYGGMRDTIKDSEEIRDELLKLAYGLWNKIKNYDKGAENLDLVWVGASPGKRESRRFIGDYILTQNDILSHTLFPDRIAYGGFTIDLHTPGGIYSRYAGAEHLPTYGLYSIPFRCLYSKNIKNLLMAGRIISVTHVALGSTRIQKQTALIGQAAGTGAHLCIKYNTIPRVIREKYVMELQQLLLKHDAFILGLKNDDPGDLARAAMVVASSTQRLDVMPSVEYELNVSELDSPMGEMFLITEPKIESIDLLLESRIENDVELQLGLRPAISIDDFSSEEDIATTSSVIPGTGCPQPVNQQPPIAPVKRTLVTFKLGKELEPGYYWIWLPKMPDIYWCGVSREPIATRRVNMVNGEWRPIKRRGTYCFRLMPPSLPYKAENVVNGVTHPTDGPNIWISENGLPQYVELDFGRPKHISKVYLTFDSNLDEEITLAWGGRTPMPPSELVRDYTLYCDLDGSWVKLVEEKGNYQRHRKHSFDPVTTRKIRLEVQATNGIPQARIYEIRCYGEEQ